MHSYLIRNSLVRNVVSRSWSTICLPGANWEDIILHVLHNANEFRNSFLYILVGPVRFTRLHRTHGRKECVLNDVSVGTPKSVFRQFDRAARNLNIVPVLCTIYPLDFHDYNQHIKKQRLICQGFYEEWTEKLRGMVTVENRLIVNFNITRGMATPYIHRRIYHRSHGKYRMRKQFISDGLHPTDAITREWIGEIERTVRLNCQAWRQRHA